MAVFLGQPTGVMSPGSAILEVLANSHKTTAGHTQGQAMIENENHSISSLASWLTLSQTPKAENTGNECTSGDRRYHTVAMLGSPAMVFELGGVDGQPQLTSTGTAASDLRRKMALLTTRLGKSEDRKMEIENDLWQVLSVDIGEPIETFEGYPVPMTILARRLGLAESCVEKKIVLGRWAAMWFGSNCAVVPQSERILWKPPASDGPGALHEARLMCISLNM